MTCTSLTRFVHKKDRMKVLNMKIYLIAHKNSYTSEAAFLRPKTGSRIAHLPLLNCCELYSGEEVDILVGNRGESFAQRSHNNLEFS